MLVLGQLHPKVDDMIQTYTHFGIFMLKLAVDCINYILPVYLDYPALR